MDAKLLLGNSQIAKLLASFFTVKLGEFRIALVFSASNERSATDRPYHPMVSRETE